MRLLFIASLLLCSFAPSPVCSARQAAGAPAKQPDAAPAVGRIAILDEKGKDFYGGTRFWIAPDVAVTTWHIVLRGPINRRAVIHMPGDRVYTATAILGVDERADLAPLRAEPPFEGTLRPAWY